ncbi:hypothetical protein [Qipengyuania sp. SM2507]
MKQTPPRTPPQAHRRVAAPAPAPAPTTPAALASGLSLPVLAAAQAALPAVKRRRAAIGSRGPRWTKARQAAFLAALAETHSVAEAARAVGMSRQSAYRLRTRLRGEPFAMAWDAAYASAPHSLYRAALERAIAGVEVPHYANGELVGTSRKFDERLTLALLAIPAPARAALGFDTPGSRYNPDDFRTLLLRVEHGSERFEAWDTERALRADEAAEDFDDEWEEDREQQPEDEGQGAPLTPDLSPGDE